VAHILCQQILNRGAELTNKKKVVWTFKTASGNSRGTVFAKTRFKTSVTLLVIASQQQEDRLFFFSSIPFTFCKEQQKCNFFILRIFYA
jgi:hypothetical protein